MIAKLRKNPEIDKIVESERYTRLYTEEQKRALTVRPGITD